MGKDSDDILDEFIGDRLTALPSRPGSFSHPPNSAARRDALGRIGELEGNIKRINAREGGLKWFGDLAARFKQILELKRLPDTTQNYLRTMAWTKYYREDRPSFSQKASHKLRSRYLNIHDWLKKSRVFDVNPNDVGEMLEEADDMLDNIIGSSFGEEWDMKAYEFLYEMDFPDPLPYAHTYVGFGEGIELDASSAQTGDLITRGLRAMGLLYDNRGDITLIFSQRVPDVYEKGTDEFDVALPVMFLSLTDRYDGWNFHGVRSFQVAAVGIIDAINANRTLIIEAPKTHKKDRAKIRKLEKALDLKTIPKPFFTSRIESRLFIQSLKNVLAVPKRAWNYRTDRRAHERVRIRRGPLPLDDDTREFLLTPRKDGLSYRVYEDDAKMSSDDEDRLRMRGKSIRKDGEWLAVLVTHVEAHIVGPDSAPYRPRTNVVKTLFPRD